jgi:hypothetical protein
VTTEVLPAAALPRVLWLRARLEQGNPSRTNGRAEWSAARVLWSHADPEIRAASDPIVQPQRSGSNGERK